jgi:hypothetical protein
MASDARVVPLLPGVNSLQITDQLVVVSNATSNVSGNVSLITLGNFFSNCSLFTTQADPASSSAWSGPKGALFFSNTYGYFSTSNSSLVRWALNTF